MSSNSSLDLLSDDLLHQILVTATKNTYLIHGTISKRFHGIYGKYNIPKQTYLYGYAPVEIINEKYDKEDHHRWTNESNYDCVLNGVLHGIVEFKRDDLLQWTVVEKKNFFMLSQLIQRSIFRHGNMNNVIQKIYHASNEDSQKGLRHTGFILQVAVKSDNIELVKWLLSEGFYRDSIVLHFAIHNGNVKMLDCLHSNGVNYWMKWNLLSALDGSNDLSDDKRAEILRWIENNGR